ncbi:MAG: hypothetical protein Q8P46_17785 [Hyphomicrobiales bacterium]|nr:hypothetical protein [Hyphomicrobiales bacterium]
MNTTDLPRPKWMSKKHREYLHRLMVRKGVLDIRICTTTLCDTQELVKERNALEWAIAKLADKETWL